MSAGAACNTATGRVLQVGPGRTYAVPSAAAAVAQAGDVIKIDGGDYRGDVASWTVNNLTICGMGTRARLFANGNNARGKGLWVVSGANITIDNIEFRDTTVPDQNGAGIRAEHTGDLRILNSGFYDNENGILANAGSATITIESSEFARNGRGDGYTHNIYVNQIDRLTVNSSYFHEAKVGHNLKSRARESIIQNSYFMDGPTGTSSYLADFPNGGRVYLRGNLFHKGPLAENNNAIAYGMEGLSNPGTSLELVHNTVAITRSGGAYLSVAGGASVTLSANLFAGPFRQQLLQRDAVEQCELGGRQPGGCDQHQRPELLAQCGAAGTDCAARCAGCDLHARCAHAVRLPGDLGQPQGRRPAGRTLRRRRPRRW